MADPGAGPQGSSSGALAVLRTGRGRGGLVDSELGLPLLSVEVSFLSHSGPPSTHGSGVLGPPGQLGGKEALHCRGVGRERLVGTDGHPIQSGDGHPSAHEGALRLHLPGAPGASAWLRRSFRSARALPMRPAPVEPPDGGPEARGTGSALGSRLSPEPSGVTSVLGSPWLSWEEVSTPGPSMSASGSPGPTERRPPGQAWGAGGPLGFGRLPLPAWRVLSGVPTLPSY